MGCDDADMLNRPMEWSILVASRRLKPYTVGPAMSLRTSCWLLPQNEQ
jgi:hypothetical protein